MLGKADKVTSPSWREDQESYLASPPQSFRATLTQPQILDLTGILQFLHLPHSHFNRLAGHDTMAVIQINVVHAESLQRFVARLMDVLGLVADFALPRLRIHVIRELGGEKDVLPLARVGFEPSARPEIKAC